VADTRGVSRAGGHTDPRPPACVQRKRELAAELWSLALVPAAFAAFVVVNGGVVVGDRAHHAPAAHWAQPLYALLFAAAAFAPVHFRPRRRAPLAHARVVGGQSIRHLESHMLCVATWCILALAVAPRAWLWGGRSRSWIRRALPACRLLQAARALKHAARARPRRLARAAAMAVLVIGYGIRYGTLAHPFLLADNRCARGCSCAGHRVG